MNHITHMGSHLTVILWTLVYGELCESMILAMDV